MAGDQGVWGVGLEQGVPRNDSFGRLRAIGLRGRLGRWRGVVRGGDGAGGSGVTGRRRLLRVRDSARFLVFYDRLLLMDRMCSHILSQGASNGQHTVSSLYALYSKAKCQALTYREPSPDREPGQVAKKMSLGSKSPKGTSKRPSREPKHSLWDI